MRRAFFVAAGIAAVLLWWQPWRRLLQQGQNSGDGGFQGGSPTGGNYDASSNWQSSSPYSSNTFSGTSSYGSGPTQTFGATSAPVDSALGSSASNTQDINSIGMDSGDNSTTGTVSSETVFADAEAMIEQGEAAMLASDAPPALDTVLSPEPAEEADYSVESTLTDLDSTTETFAAGETSDTLGIDQAEASGDITIDEMLDIDETDAPTNEFTSETGASDTSPAASADTLGIAGANTETDEFTDETGASDTSAVVSSDTDTSATEETSDDVNVAVPTTDATPDDLILIEGIGPKISTILTAAGITSFAQLAETDVERLSQIVRDAGITTANPETWPQQAQLAAEGNMDDLRDFQQRIKNGKLAK